MQCDVIVVGFGLPPEPAAEALASVLALTPEAARLLISRYPAVVATALARPQAEALRDRLCALGARVELREAYGELRGREPRGRTEAPRGFPPLRRPSADYRLGDFGLPLPAKPSARDTLAEPSELDPLPLGLALSSGTFDQALELDYGTGKAPRHLAMPVGRVLPSTSEPVAPRANLEPQRAADDAPLDLDLQAKPVRPPRTTRTRPSQPPRAQPRRAHPFTRLRLGAWSSSLLLLALLLAGTVLSVGYALAPDDVFAWLRPSEVNDEAARTVAPHERSLHALLQATPRLARAPLSAMMRARIEGAHEVPVSFAHGGQTANCSLVEHAEGQTSARLARVRETGFVVEPPPEVSAQLEEHARALRAARQRPDLQFTRICLTP